MVSAELREINFSADNSCSFSHIENIYFPPKKKTLRDLAPMLSLRGAFHDL